MVVVLTSCGADLTARFIEAAARAARKRLAYPLVRSKTQMIPSDRMKSAVAKPNARSHAVQRAARGAVARLVPPRARTLSQASGEARLRALSGSDVDGNQGNQVEQHDPKLVRGNAGVLDRVEALYREREQAIADPVCPAPCEYRRSDPHKEDCVVQDDAPEKEVFDDSWCHAASPDGEELRRVPGPTREMRALRGARRDLVERPVATAERGGCIAPRRILQTIFRCLPSRVSRLAIVRIAKRRGIRSGPRLQRCAA